MPYNIGPVSPSGQPPNSNIMLLPQLGGMSFSIANNAGWYDSLIFTQSANNTAPLDISSIDFHAELRSSAADPSNKLDMSSMATQPQFVVGGINGTLFFSVDASLIVKLSPGVYVMDMVAIDIVTQMKRNLCEGGPIAVTVLQGVTR